MTQTLKSPKIVIYGQEGGARSYIGLLLLQKLYEKTGIHISKAADYLSGASGSQIFLSALDVPQKNNPNEPRYTEAQVADLYIDALPRIFVKGKLRHLFGMLNNNLPLVSHDAALRQFLRNHYFHDQQILEDCLKNLFGEQTLVKDTIIPTIIPMRDFAGQNHRASKIANIEGQATNFADLPLYQAVMASCMAPLAYDSYSFVYEGQNYNMIDGAMFEKPAFVTNIVESNEPDSDVHVIYLGTGYEKTSHTVDGYRNSNHDGLFSIRRNFILAREFCDSIAQASDSSLKHRLKDRLYVINFDLADYFPQGKIPYMDDARPEILERYRHIANDVYAKNTETFDAIAQLFDYKMNHDTTEIPSNRGWRMPRIIQSLSTQIPWLAQPKVPSIKDAITPIQEKHRVLGASCP